MWDSCIEFGKGILEMLIIILIFIVGVALVLISVPFLLVLGLIFELADKFISKSNKGKHNV